MKFKGLYRVLPLAAFKEGSMRERVVRTLAIPPGPWQFPTKVEGKDSLKLDPMPGYLGDFRDEKNDEKDENWEEEIERFNREMEGMAENKGDGTSPARTAGGTKAGFETDQTDKPEASKDVGARNRSITAIRIAIHGPSKGCQACKDGTYSHTKECRARFNELLDITEPKKSTKSTPILCEDLPSSAPESFPEGDDLESATDISGLISTATGGFVSKQSNDIERGNEALLSEASQMRSLGVWDESRAVEVDELLSRLSRPDLSFSIVSLAGVPKLNIYCDADLAGDHLTCKSHSGIYVVLDFGDGSGFPLSWSSKRQTAVARSTTEAELASANEGIFQDGIPIKILLERVLGSEVHTALREDNTACISVIQAGYSPKLRSMSRTHRISVAALSEALTTKVIDIEHVESKLQLADILTKALNRITFLQIESSAFGTMRRAAASISIASLRCGR
eukprot:s1470_g4.t1